MSKANLFYRINAKLFFFSLFILITGIFTFIKCISLYPILAAIPCCYFTFKFFKTRGLEGIYYFNNGQWAIIGIFFLFIISTLINFNSLKSFYFFFQYIKYFPLTLLSVFAFKEVFQNYLEIKDKRILLNFFLICGSIGSIYGLITMILGYYPLSGKILIWSNRNNGPGNDLMNYSPILAFFLVIVTGILIYSKYFKNYISFKWILFHWVINFIALYFTYTRGAWLSFFFSIPFLFFRKSKKLVLAVGILGILFLILSIIINPDAKERFLHSDDSNNQRITLYKTALYAFLEKPILGWGFENFSKNSFGLAKKYDVSWPWNDWKGAHAHNNFLEILVATGFPGFILLLFFHLFWARDSLESSTPFGEINLAFLISFFIFGMVDCSIIQKDPFVFVFTFYSLSRALLFKEKKREKEESLEFKFQT
jgi:O-antigen ligase